MVGGIVRCSWKLTAEIRCIRCITTWQLSKAASTATATNSSKPHRVGNVQTLLSYRPNYSFGFIRRPPHHLLPVRCQYFSSTTNIHPNKAQEEKHWNARAEEFLSKNKLLTAITFTENDFSSSNVLTTTTATATETENSERLRKDADTILTLLDDLVQYVLLMKQKGKNRRVEDVVVDVPMKANEYYNNDKQYNSETNAPSLYSSSSSKFDHVGFDSSKKSEIYTEQSIEVGFAFELLDILVSFEQMDKSPLINLALKWTDHMNCLNSILHLWKLKNSPPTDSKFTKSHTTSKKMNDPDTDFNNKCGILLNPSQVLAKLDKYRQDSNLLIPDIESYNIILDAVATYANSSYNTKRIKGKINNSRHKDGKVVDIEFCQSLWDWLWQESAQDSVIRPDEVTLRTMLKAHVLTGHDLAPQRCEVLVEDWIKHQNYNSNSNIPYDHQEEYQTIYDPKGSILLSLVHVWALHDPYVAESYLKELSHRYLSELSYYPPDTVAWDRVISAYAIAHNKPDKARQVLQDWWEFYRSVHGLVDSTHNNTDGDFAARNDHKKTMATGNSSSRAYNFMSRVCHPSLVTYNAVLEGYARQENAYEANNIFSRLKMTSSTSPDIVTYTSTIKANGRDLKKVNELAQQCIAIYSAQAQSTDEEYQDRESTKHFRLDNAFFHAWLDACVKAKNIVEAKSILKQMKSLNIKPNATTYIKLVDVFLCKNESQAAIEWLLAYAKLERMSESAIVSCAINILDWYRNNSNHDTGMESGGFDAMIFLEILCEDNFLTQEDALQPLLLGISANQGKAVLGWLRKNKRSSLKIWAIVLRALSQEGSQAQIVDELFLELQGEYSLREKFNANTSVFSGEERKLFAEIYGSIIVAWSKQNNLERIKHWTEQLNKFPGDPLPLDLAAQIAIITMYCRAQEPVEAEKYFYELERAHEEGNVVSPPNTIMCNMILNAWAQKNNGKRAAAFFEKKIKEPNSVSYNTVINAFAREGKVEQAERWAYELVSSYCKDPVESRRPQQATFTVILAGWRRSKNRDAAERAEKVLTQMHQLYDNGILLQKPNLISYRTVLDTWEKSYNQNSAKKAEQFLLSSSDFSDNSKLRSKVRKMKSQERERNRRFKEG